MHTQDPREYLLPILSHTHTHLYIPSRSAPSRGGGVAQVQGWRREGGRVSLSLSRGSRGITRRWFQQVVYRNNLTQIPDAKKGGREVGVRV